MHPGGVLKPQERTETQGALTQKRSEVLDTLGRDLGVLTAIFCPVCSPNLQYQRRAVPPWKLGGHGLGTYKDRTEVKETIVLR